MKTPLHESSSHDIISICLFVGNSVRNEVENKDTAKIAPEKEHAPAVAYEDYENPSEENDENDSEDEEEESNSEGKS